MSSVATGEDVINLCANNYLGLAQDERVKAAAQEGLERWGYGMASVRFICGTQAVHKQLEDQLSDWLRMEDTILYPSCFDANGGLFETLLGAEDAVISDELNHASIIDGVRLCKAQRYRYRNADMADLEAQLQAADAAGARFKLIATDGVFSMDGYIAPLDRICDLAERYGALVHVDDSHATGVVGAGGRGTPEHCGVMDRVDIITGTLGKALGGASGGFTSAKQRDRRAAPPALAPLSLLQHRRPAMVAGAAQGGRAGRGGRRPARAAARQYALLPRRPDRRRLRAAARRPSDHPGHAPRRPPRRRARRGAAGQGHLRHRFLLPGRAQGQGPHPHPDLRHATPARSWSARSRPSPRQGRSWRKT